MRQHFRRYIFCGILLAFFGVTPIAAATTGTLEVYSDPPGAKVYINEIFVGRTPYRNEEMPLGTHRVRALLREDLPSATWEGVINGVGPETIRFYFEKTPAVKTTPATVEHSPPPSAVAPREIAVPSIPSAPRQSPEETGAGVPSSPVQAGNWGHLELRVDLTGTPPGIDVEKCYLRVVTELPVALADLKDGDFWVGDFEKRTRRDQFGYSKPDETLVHAWDESCRAIEYDGASVITDIRPGVYELKISRRVKTRTLKFGVVPDDDMLYRLADKETVSIGPGATTRVLVTVDVEKGSYSIERR